MSRFSRVQSCFCTVALALWMTGGQSGRAADVASLLPEGNLETDANADGWPDGFERKENVSWESEAGDHFLRLQQKNAGEFTGIYNAVPIAAGVTALHFHFRFRTAKVVRGTENYYDARFIFHFRDADKHEQKTAPDALVLPDNSGGWQERDVQFEVPANAAILEIMPTLFQVASGVLDIDDLRLTVAQNIAPAVALPIEPAIDAPPPALKVVGNQLQTPDGKAVILRGVNVPSLDWMPEGDHVLQSVIVAVADWKCGAIRLPISDEFWFGRGPRQNDGGAAYRALVQSCARAANARGAYVILDLHEYRAIQPKHLKFWAEICALYQGNPAVLFDILNEPHDISWQVWRDGGLVEERAAEGDKPAVTFQSPGMQTTVDFIRAQGARNVIVAGGLDWGYDLSGVAGEFALKDPQGDGILYSSHVYSWKRNWQGRVLAAAAKYPVILGEFGADEKRLPSVPAADQEDPYIWVPEVLGFARQNNLSWTAWSFHTDATPRLLANWEYQPTPFFGSFVRAALLGARFEMTKLR